MTAASRAATELLVRQPDGFGWGYTALTSIGELVADTGIAFGILRLRAGERYAPDPGLEGALLLLDGRARLGFGDRWRDTERCSLFDAEPVALHFPAGEAVSVTALADCELAVIQTAADRGARFEATVFDAETMLASEHRGQGKLDDTACRIVRTIFDRRNRPAARLVLGEVITLPGRWSSYPPHHHPQPEIYHYRFTDPAGYGHAELGEQVLRVRQFDTVKILDGLDHPQVAAPGYGMYYIWAIRHLPGAPYTAPELTEAHAWLEQPEPDPRRLWRAGRPAPETQE